MLDVARHSWVLGGVVGLAAIVVAFAAGSSDDTSAKSVTSPPRATDTTAAGAATSPAITTTTPPTTAIAPTTTAAPTTTIDARPFNSAAFDAVISAATVDVGDVSAGAAVIRNGEVLHAAGFGMENPVEAKAASPSTRFRLGSVSKLLTSVAIMQLVDEGRIELDESFAAQLGIDGPFADPRVATVTVRQLLSHMSGFGVARNLYFGHGVDT